MYYYSLSGSAVGIMDSPVFAMLNKYFRKKRGSANSLAFVGSGIGCFLIPILVRICVSLYSIRGTMIVLAGLWLQPCIIGALFRPIRLVKSEVSSDEGNRKLKRAEAKMNISGENTKKDGCVIEYDVCNNSLTLIPSTSNIESQDDEPMTKQLMISHEDHNSEKTYTHSNKNNRKSAVTKGLKDYFTFLRNPPMLRILLAIMLGSFAYFNQMFLFPPLAQELEFGGMQGAVLISITGVAEMVSRIPLGYLSDRSFINKQCLVASLSLTCFVIAFIVSFVPHVIALNVYAGIMGMIGGTTVPLAMPMLTGVVSNQNIGSASGLFLLAMSIAFATGPPLLGSVIE